MGSKEVGRCGFGFGGRAKPCMDPRQRVMDSPLNETFRGPRLDPRLRWHAEPSGWCLDPGAQGLVIRPGAGTDFWQRTHYGFEADNGHFLHLEATGDFELTTCVTSHPVHQYDQAGLMVRISSACWLKTSVEYEPEGPNRLGAVVTNAQFSDWSMQPLAKDVATVWLRVRARGCDYTVDCSREGRRWETLRLARLHDRAAAPSVTCGLYACSPKGAGYRAVFSFLRFDPERTGGSSV